VRRRAREGAAAKPSKKARKPAPPPQEGPAKGPAPPSEPKGGISHAEAKRLAAAGTKRRGGSDGEHDDLRRVGLRVGRAVCVCV
jgi:hypothetical protein